MTRERIDARAFALSLLLVAIVALLAWLADAETIIDGPAQATARPVTKRV